MNNTNLPIGPAQRQMPFFWGAPASDTPSLDPTQSRVNKAGVAKLNAALVEDVTYPPDSILAPNTKFTKTWRFQNNGGLEWPQTIKLLFVSNLTGGQMSGPNEKLITLPHKIAIDEQVDISVDLIAPAEPRVHTGFWKLSTNEGYKFGPRVKVRIEVKNTPEAEILPTDKADITTV